MTKKKYIELMAPAGDFNSLSAAINAGADSVYFGIGELNMRARASVNFTPRDLAKIVRRCRNAGVKSYLTLNVVIFNHEIGQIKKICGTAKKAGIDAVIAGDPAVIVYAHSIGLPVHISVQAGVANLEAVKFYAPYADVIVLARELALPQIAQITAGIKREKIVGPSGELIKIEIFAHGALCVSYSGKCYMSLGVYHTSANRGNCYQNCRRRYRVIDDENGNELVVDNQYVMSPKDICTIKFIDQILDSGVSVLKIEGMGRAAEYVDVVTRCYREAVDAWRRGEFNAALADGWLVRLEQVFNRGFWHGGYYLGEQLGEWCNSGGNQSRTMKTQLGRVNKYFSQIKVAELSVESEGLSVGQQIMIIGSTTGVVSAVVQSLRIGGVEVQFAPKGSVVSVPFPEKVRKNDALYLISVRPYGVAGGD